MLIPNSVLNIQIANFLIIIQVLLSSNAKENIDVYRLKIGVRSLHWSNKEFLINGKPIYFRGFGRHEDSDVSRFNPFFLWISFGSMCQTNNILLNFTRI